MKALTVAVALIVAALALSRAAGESGSDRPPGIAADEWVPLSATLGVVLVPEPEPFLGKTGAGAAQPAPQEGASQGRTAAAAAPQIGPTDLLVPTIPLVRSAMEHAEAAAGEPMHGYLMVRQGRYWRRLIVAP